LIGPINGIQHIKDLICEPVRGEGYLPYITRCILGITTNKKEQIEKYLVFETHI